MSWDPVPWFVGGGAQHSPEVARLLAYAATSGSEGIVAPGDLQVRALDVPGGSVRVSAGAAFILNRAVGGGQQTYVARLPEEDLANIAATGSASGRSDLIVAMVEDPFMPGEPWQEPADPTQGPYMFTRVIPNVPAGTKRLRDVPGYEGRSAIELARVDLPSSTGTVTNAMITNLQKVAIPKSLPVLRSHALVAGNTETLTATIAAGEIWPNASSDAWASVEIPLWATRVRIVGMWTGVDIPPGEASGVVWVQIGAATDPAYISTQEGGWNSPNVNNHSRQVFMIGDDRPVPASMRGLTRKIYPKARLTAVSVPGARPVMDWATSTVVQLEFYQG